MTNSDYTTSSLNQSDICLDDQQVAHLLSTTLLFVGQDHCETMRLSNVVLENDELRLKYWE
jgi:hypothetical protein